MIARPASVLLLLRGCWLAGCGPVEPPFVGELALFDNAQTIVVEGRDGALSAVVADTGRVHWRYRPPPEPFPSFVAPPTRHLVCPLERTPAGALLLRYHGRLLAVDSRTGHTLWKRGLAGWASRDRRCPKPTPDSGVLLLRGDGLFLQKLDSAGRDSWRFTLGNLGAAVAPVHVSLPSGDSLVRTRTHVGSISPAGTLNWARRR